MLRIVSFGLLIVLQVVSAEPPPPHCRGPPPGVTNPGKCCDMPKIFKDEDLKDCGIEMPSEGEGFRGGPPDCSKPTCLLKKYNLMKDDEVDKDAVTGFLDKIVEGNPEFKDAVEKSKEICLKSDPPGPPHLCAPLRIMFCMKHVVFMECPKWDDSENCKKLKDHIEECKPYFLQQ